MKKEGSSARKRLALIASKGTLDWAYPPFILASTAAAMGMEVGIFFTFYGLSLLARELDPKVSPQGNPALPFRLPFGPRALQEVDWPIPNLLSTNLPGFETLASSMMRETFASRGVATVEELRTACLESGVRLIACEMTLEVFGFAREDLIDGIELGGAATFLEFAADADIQLFV